jgi:hypothetical protein
MNQQTKEQIGITQKQTKTSKSNPKIIRTTLQKHATRIKEKPILTFNQTPQSQKRIRKAHKGI